MTTSVRSGKRVDAPMVRPSWMDPRYMLAATDWTEVPFTVPAGTVTRCLTRNARRWAVGFRVVVTSPPTILVGPNTRVQTYGDTVASAFGTTWWVLTQVGPVVCGEWYAFSAAGGAMLMSEVFLR